MKSFLTSAILLASFQTFAASQIECFVMEKSGSLNKKPLTAAGYASLTGTGNGLSYRVTAVGGNIDLVNMTDGSGANVRANLSRHGLTDIQLTLNNKTLVCKISEVVAQ